MKPWLFSFLLLLVPISCRTKSGPAIVPTLSLTEPPKAPASAKPVVVDADRELLETFPYGLVASFTSTTTVLLPMPPGMKNLLNCLPPPRLKERYARPLPLPDFSEASCAQAISLLHRLPGRNLRLFDDHGRQTVGTVVEVRIEPQLAAFRNDEVEQGLIPVAEAYGGAPIVELTVKAITAAPDSAWVLARLLPLPAPEFTAPLTKPSPAQTAFVSSQLAEFRRRLKADGVASTEAEANSATYVTQEGLVFFGDLEQGDPPCGPETGDYAQVSQAAFAGGPISFDTGPLRKELPVLVWYDPRLGFTLMLFRERYSGRPQLYRFHQNALVPLLELPTVHPANHPC